MKTVLLFFNYPLNLTGFKLFTRVNHAINFNTTMPKDNFSGKKQLTERVKKRIQIQSLVSLNLTGSEIARRLNISERTVARWKKQEPCEDKVRTGRPKKNEGRVGSRRRKTPNSNTPSPKKQKTVQSSGIVTDIIEHQQDASNIQQQIVDDDAQLRLQLESVTSLLDQTNEELANMQANYQHLMEENQRLQMTQNELRAALQSSLEANNKLRQDLEQYGHKPEPYDYGPSILLASLDSEIDDSLQSQINDPNDQTVTIVVTSDNTDDV